MGITTYRRTDTSHDTRNALSLSWLRDRKGPNLAGRDAQGPDISPYKLSKPS